MPAVLRMGAVLFKSLIAPEFFTEALKSAQVSEVLVCLNNLKFLFQRDLSTQVTLADFLPEAPSAVNPEIYHAY